MAVVVADGIDRYLCENYTQSLRVPVNFCLISPGLVTVLSASTQTALRSGIHPLHCLNPDCPELGYPPATLPEPRLP